MATAYAALVSLFNNLDLIQNHPRHSFSFDNKQIQTLSGNVIFLIEFMKSYDDSQGCSKEVAEALERRIARAAHAAEDVIESHVVDQIRAGSTLLGKRTSRFLLDLQKVIEGMDFVCRKASKVLEAQGGFEVELPTSSAAATPSTPLTSQKNSNSMVGFDDILLQLLDQLTGEPSSRRVIPIVGMGGTGKTTLAKNAFQHPLIVQHFDVCLWATISQQYSAEKILTELLSGLRKSTSKTVDDIGEKLHKSLYARRYLIIVDDMWSVEAWDEIRSYFPHADNGSRIVVTSRHSYVADHLESLHLKMSSLDVDNSWDLFCQKAFVEQVCTPELEKIGKMIVEKCRGLPLAIVVVGGHLRKSSMAVEYWESVAQHMNSILTWAENESCLNVLSLSYSYLPAYLKPCFLFMGVFPEDKEIYMWDILRLWIAEGFIIKPFDDTSLEEAAEDYLWDLFERNLIIVDRLGCNGEIITFQIHDLVRELCLKLATEDGFLYVLNSSPGAGAGAVSRERRVLTNEKIPGVNDQPKIFHAPRPASDHVRSLICKGGQLSCDLKLLRVLYKVDSASISEAIFERVNLRLLNVDLDYKSRTLYLLPSSISQLWNLQILTITTASRSIVIAPYEVWEMLQLRHLEVDPICLVDPLPTDNLDQANDLVLRNLHTLLRVENLRLSEEVCKRIPNIKELQISYCDLGRDCDEARSYYCPQNLGCFHQLEYIVCQFDRRRDFALSLTFPSSLKWLSLAGSCLEWEGLTVMVGSLPQLLSLELRQNSVIGSTWAPVEGKFLRLKQLFLSCDELVYWNADSSHFPVLEKLFFRNLSKLGDFPSGIGEIPTLEWIELDSCSLSSSISAMRMLAEQEALGNQGFQLCVYFRDDEETLERFKFMVQEEGLISTNLFLRPQSSIS